MDKGKLNPALHPLDFDACRELDAGFIDFSGILKTGAKSGKGYFIGKQEKCTASTLDAARIDARYMGNLNI